MAAAVLSPVEWFSSRVEVKPDMMTISIGGVQGPDTGGLTPISGRAVQTVAPPEARPRDAAPAPKAPEMIEPAPVKTPPRTGKPIEKPADKAPARKPTSGAEIKEGAARANTGGAETAFPGLTAAGGGDGQAFTDYANFCCPTYLNTLVQLIRRNWNPNQGAAGMVLMKFTVRSDGRIVDIEHEKRSDIYLLDTEAQRALTKTALPPLPREFPDDQLIVHLWFQYKR
jgi:TonB family protein